MSPICTVDQYLISGFIAHSEPVNMIRTEFLFQNSLAMENL